MNLTNAIPAWPDLHDDVLKGLAERPRRIPFFHLFDRAGVELYTELRKQPEFYQARIEASLLDYYADEITSPLSENTVFTTLGIADPEAHSQLLHALQNPAETKIQDIDTPSPLAPLLVKYNWIYPRSFSLCNENPHQARQCIFLPAPAIGMIPHDAMIEFLEDIASAAGSDGRILLGLDLPKGDHVFNSALNDPQGLAEQFNLNLLNRLVNELGAQMNINAFAHQAFYNESECRMEMHLASTTNSSLIIDNKSFAFHLGDSILTDLSYKYSLEQFAELSKKAGLELEQQWIDRKEYYCLQMLKISDRP